MQQSTRPWFIRNARALLVAGFSLVLLALVAAIVIVIRSGEAEDLVEHTLEVRQVAQNLFIFIEDAETAERGYLLTADEHYLDLYNVELPQIPALFDQLRTMTADNVVQQTELGRLKPLMDAKLEFVRHILELARSGQHDAAVEEVRTNRGRQLMLDLRASVRAIVTEERSLLPPREAATDRLRAWLLVFIGVCLGTALLLTAALGRSTQYYIAQLRQRTGELLSEASLRQQTEETLRQSQKLELVGQLTGGIAHDFNNLLTIIIGNLDTLKRRLSAPSAEQVAALKESLGAPIELALKGARSAAQLTHRLLAYARRQPLEPTRLDLNRLVSTMSDLLTRTLGESINVETVLAGGLWRTFADANQVENALLNLAINARDAMKDGGRLTIETANSFLDDAYAARFGDVKPGQYVLLSVTDTGVGIPTEVMERVFEPFFTTKGDGEGSGLGLAMVHGFVKQTDGHVRIYSEVGQGTSVKIYLPRLLDAEEVLAAPAEKITTVSAARGAQPEETILVVEDNVGVRQYATDALKEMGYRVLEVGDADGALRIVDGGGRIDLLFTDVVLPGGMNGRELAAKVAKRRPRLPVLFTTGYTRNAIVHHGRLDANVRLLGKPYTLQDLAQKVREILDGTAPMPDPSVRPADQARPPV
ncbi:MAG TPA: CHASE3 domain-containing protein [Bauldia sp.]